MSDRIRILATSDLHGMIYPYSYADKLSHFHGLARINSMISLLRDENTILLDNGDTLEGSPLSFYHYMFQTDDINPMTDVMREMHYDYINVGNHDFSYGEEALMMHLQNVGAPCITANWRFHGENYGPTYVIKEVAGKRIAIFALVTQYIPHWERKEKIRHCKFQDAYETAEKTVALLKSLEKPDYIVCMYHGGFERDLQYGYLTEEDTGENEGYRMLKNIQGIDVLISGHQHRSLSGKLFNTYFTQTAQDGKEIACIDIYPDTDTIEPRIFKVDTEPDTRVMAYVQDEEDKCQEWLDQTLGTTKVDLKVTDEFDARLHKSQMVTFLNKVQMETTKADLSGTALFNGATGFDQNITMRNLVSTYTFPNTLVVKKVTGKILKEYLEKNAEYWTIKNGGIAVNKSYETPTPMHFNYDMIDGIEYTIQVSNPLGSRIIEMKYNGELVTEDQEFTLVINNYRASGSGGFDMIRNAPTVRTDLTNIVELLAKYIMDHQTIDFTPIHNINIIK